jgi:polyketide cyclase/dehydrase/lipid transport protein
MRTGALIVEGQVAIARTPQEVFVALADPTSWASVDPALVDVTPSRPLVPGSSGTMRRRVGPDLTVKTAWENTEFVPGARLENLIKGFGYELRETVVLEAAPIGTQMTVVDTLTPTSLVGRAFVAMSRTFIERDLHSRFAKLKLLLETGSATERTPG